MSGTLRQFHEGPFIPEQRLMDYHALSSPWGCAERYRVNGPSDDTVVTGNGYGYLKCYQNGPMNGEWSINPVQGLFRIATLPVLVSSFEDLQGIIANRSWVLDGGINLLTLEDCSQLPLKATPSEIIASSSDASFTNRESNLFLFHSPDKGYHHYLEIVLNGPHAGSWRGWIVMNDNIREWEMTTLDLEVHGDYPLIREMTYSTMPWSKPLGVSKLHFATLEFGVEPASAFAFWVGLPGMPVIDRTPRYPRLGRFDGERVVWHEGLPATNLQPSSGKVARGLGVLLIGGASILLLSSFRQHSIFKSRGRQEGS